LDIVLNGGLETSSRRSSKTSSRISGRRASRNTTAHRRISPRHAVSYSRGAHRFTRGAPRRSRGASAEKPRTRAGAGTYLSSAFTSASAEPAGSGFEFFVSPFTRFRGNENTSRSIALRSADGRGGAAAATVAPSKPLVSRATRRGTSSGVRDARRDPRSVLEAPSPPPRALSARRGAFGAPGGGRAIVPRERAEPKRAREEQTRGREPERAAASGATA
jgi:hypothetical protein